MVKTVSKLFRVISDKTLSKSVRFMKWHVIINFLFLRKKGYCHYLMAVTNPLICAQDY